MKRNKVFIVHPSWDYSRMFRLYDWDLTDTIAAADLVQFTGGEDVTPSLYGQATHARTSCNHERDRQEVVIFGYARKLDKPMAGICRGGQFLNVMSGGTMWQDVNNHGMDHKAVDTRTGESIKVTSTHHQMMIPGETGNVILKAKESSFKVGCRDNPQHIILADCGSRDDYDTEAVYYRKFNTFCFQPHPEFPNSGIAKTYMKYLSEFFGFTIPNTN